MASLIDKNKAPKIFVSNDDEKQVVVVHQEIDKKGHGSDNKEMLEGFSKQNNIPIFKGKVENGYESDFLGYKDKCPLCNTPTEQMYSNFIWTSQIGTRLMAVPAGYFCPNCPTVIIDDDLMKVGVNKARFQYWGTIAIDTGFSKDKSPPNRFSTFNGEKPTYILDERGSLDGILNSVHQPSGQSFMEGTPETLALLQNNANKTNSASNIDTISNSTNTLKEKNQKAKSKKKNKQAKQSRKANRKK